MCFHHSTPAPDGRMSPHLPNHVSSRAHDIIVACIVGPIVATIIVGIRVWTRVVVTHNLGWDDYATMVTLPFCIGFSVVLGVSTRYGMGLHLWDVSSISELLVQFSVGSSTYILRRGYPSSALRLSRPVSSHGYVSRYRIADSNIDR